jgi:maleate isomerase
MKRLPFEIEDDPADQPAVGLVVLQTDETMEHELRHWLPATVRLFHTRIPNQVAINSDSLQQMKYALPAATALLPSTTRFQVIVYGCTSAATVIGEAAVTDAVQSILPGVAVTNPLTAIKAQLGFLQAKSIALLTPYVPDVSQAMVDSFIAADFDVARVASFHEERDDRVARIAEHSLMAALTDLAAGNPVDAIVASCTNLRTRGLIELASKQLGVPVISSNSALAWHVMRLLDAGASHDLSR